MEKQEAELIFIPFPIPGHLLATIELVKLILTHGRRRIHTITILHWGLPIFPPSDKDASLQTLAKTESRIRIVTLPELQNPPPMEFFLKAPEYYILEFVKKMVPSVRDAVSTVLSSSRDGSDTARVAGETPSRQIGIRPELRRRGEYCSWIRHLCSYDTWVDMTGRFHEAKGILVNSSKSIEPNAFSYFESIPVYDYPPVYPVGPILYSNDRSILDPLERDRVMTWLDEQPESSVVFLCFGSLMNLPATQIKEIAQALEIVGCKFLWSIRTDPKDYSSLSEILPDGFLNRVSGLGFVCGWAPQVEILAHKAIGGFLSHCGWNSILESLRFGVPIATWPMFAEQQLNAFTMVKELGLALEMRLDYLLADGEIVKADEIARAVRSLMEGEDVPRRILKEIAGAAKAAVMDGGSSFVAIDRFIDKVVVSAMDCSKSR
ncbi:hypothetical protein F2Q68_00024872 [Brassica cretica]|uniref:Glycosyltransferase n=1 Tax=Brassica cretica TaxID=69181 RepID=A0A8S9I9G0_BRACR|nr:hypothetical protein F2Q68_00024872 [Brassica cretica]